MNALENHVRVKLRALRLAKGWTVSFLAKKVDLSQASVSRMETGRQNISLTQLGDFATALSVDVCDFFGDASDASDETVDDKDVLRCLQAYFEWLNKTTYKGLGADPVREAAVRLYKVLLDHPQRDALPPSPYLKSKLDNVNASSLSSLGLWREGGGE